MRVVIAAVASSEHLSGVSRHAASLAQCLLAQCSISAVHLIVADWQYEALRDVIDPCDARLHLHPVALGQGPLARNAWFYVKLPALAKQLKADIVHVAYPVPLNRSAFRCPVVVTLHDFYPYDIPANFGFPKMLFNRAILQQCLHAVDAIACVSDSTLCRLDIHAPRIALQKAVTIYNCVNPGPPMAAESPLPGWDGEPFFLCVAQHRRNKNILFALEVFRRLQRAGGMDPAMKLVIVGITGPETERIRHFVQRFHLSRHVLFLQGMTDAELQWCYGHCELLLAPSLVEGFGLPLVEAMFHHSRVVCSDIPAFREVGGSYCHYVSLESPAEDAFVEAIRSALRQFKFRPAETERFSAARVSQSYVKLYSYLQHGGSPFGISGSYELIPSLQTGGDHDSL
jgi:glycosyltransferase involved in cell wall biosynthesis